MSSYVPIDFEDGVTPLNAATFDHLEDRIELLDALKVPDPVGLDEKWLKVEGGAMVWVDPPAGGGGGGLDWEGAWAGATPYVKGDVVTYNGVTYGAVNDSTGQTPPAAQAAPGALPVIPIVTSLPVTPFDGQEVIFVDVVGAATYAWRLRYVAARATNKWIFVGGSPLFSEVAPATESTTSTSYVPLATVGPTITLPLAGDYIVEQGACSYNSGGYACYMSYDIGATPANDVDAMLISSTNASSASMRSRKKLALSAVALVSKYRVSGTTGNWHSRWMRVTPIAVGG